MVKTQLTEILKESQLNAFKHRFLKEYQLKTFKLNLIFIYFVKSIYKKYFTKKKLFIKKFFFVN